MVQRKNIHRVSIGSFHEGTQCNNASQKCTPSQAGSEKTTDLFLLELQWPSTGSLGLFDAVAVDEESND